jgi:hypothetical protein
MLKYAGHAWHACVVLLLISGSACHSNPVAPSSSSIAVTGTVPAVGQTSQLDAKATLSNGTVQDVTAVATWSSSNIAVASVTAGGLLQVLSAGSAQITATYQGVSGQFSVSQPVTSVTSVTSVTVIGPTSLTIPQPVQLTATAYLSNGTSQNVTFQATWQAPNQPVIQTSFIVSTQGIVTPLFQSLAATITASYQGVTGQISVSATEPCLVTMTSNTPNVTTNSGANLQFTLPSGGASYTVAVQAPATCGWTALAEDLPVLGTRVPSSSVTVTAGANGVGNGMFSFVVPATNSGCNSTVAIIPSDAGSNALLVEPMGDVFFVPAGGCP